MVFFILVFMDAFICSGMSTNDVHSFFTVDFSFSLQEHQSLHSLPLIVPVILPSYGERASEVLIAQLTKNYKATVVLSDVSDRP